ncbi:MAG: outer membrane protein assembly factor BamE [Proteobacteria bacterium]|nr:outer membrane protein assembly factor BamE [Pseudomonadota bacterium]
MNFLRMLATLLFCIMLSGCSWYAAHRIDMQQGNLVKPALVAQLKPGMSPEEVVNLMGSPVYVNTFKPSEIIYIYFEQKGWHKPIINKVTLEFANGRLAKIVK